MVEGHLRFVLTQLTEPNTDPVYLCCDLEDDERFSTDSSIERLGTDVAARYFHLDEGQPIQLSTRGPFLTRYSSGLEVELPIGEREMRFFLRGYQGLRENMSKKAPGAELDDDDDVGEGPGERNLYERHGPPSDGDTSE